jgi:hypothetical protein
MESARLGRARTSAPASYCIMAPVGTFPTKRAYGRRRTQRGDPVPVATDDHETLHGVGGAGHGVAQEAEALEEISC